MHINSKLIKSIPIIVSIVAVTLSQFKPLYVYFEKPKIDLIVGQRISFYEKWGNLGMNVFLQIPNTGNVGTTIEKVAFYISSLDSDYSRYLPGQSYYLKPETLEEVQRVNQIPLSNIFIEKQSVWNSFINSYLEANKATQMKIEELTLAVGQDIMSKLEPDGDIVFIEDDLYDQIIDFVRDNLDSLSIGEYQLLAMGWKQNDNNPSIMKAYSFSIYESDLQRFKNKEQEYLSGAGILYPIVNPLQIPLGFNSILTEIIDSNIVSNLYKSYQNRK
jgi:hypothetical protein